MPQTAKQSFRAQLLAIAIALFLLLVCEVQAQSVPPTASLQTALQCGAGAARKSCTPNLDPIAALVDSSVDRHIHADVLELSGGALGGTTLPSATPVVRHEPISPPSISTSLQPQTRVPVPAAGASDTTRARADLPRSLSPPLATGETDSLNRDAAWLRDRKLSRARQREEIRRRQTRAMQKNRRQQCTQSAGDLECRLALKSHALMATSRARAPLANPHWRQLSRPSSMYR